MKKKTLMAGFLLVGSSLFGQEVIATQGDSYTSASGNIDFTIGEVVIATGTDGSNDITQGFHQTNWNFLGLEDHAQQIEVAVFPNPSSDIMNIQTSSFEGLEFTMLDAKGKIVMENVLREEISSFDVSQLAPGNYNLIIRSSGETLKDFRLIKHQ